MPVTPRETVVRASGVPGRCQVTLPARCMGASPAPGLPRRLTTRSMVVWRARSGLVPRRHGYMPGGASAHRPPTQSVSSQFSQDVPSTPDASASRTGSSLVKALSTYAPIRPSGGGSADC
jgi:hypothetical protein